MSHLLFRSGLLALVLILAGCGQDQPLSESIRSLQEERSGPQANTVQRFYEQRDARPVWVTPVGPTQEGQILLEQLCQAHRVGISAGEYALDSLVQELQATYQSPANDAEEFRREVAELEVRLSETFLEHLDHLLHGAVRPAEVGGKWHINPEERDLLRIMRHAVSEGIEGTLDTLGTQNPRYTPMRRALERYQSIASEGGWPRIEAEGALGPGDEGPAVTRLRERLAATGDLSEEPETESTYSEAVAEAVRHFEERHGLPVDGDVDAEDREVLNVSAQERARQLALNMERYRWMPDDLGFEYVFVNLMDFQLTVFRDDEDVLSMPVVVGEQGWQTAAFSDTLRYAVFGPMWNVPRSIAQEDLLPQLKDAPDLLDERGYQILTMEGDTVGVDSLSEDALEEEEVRIRQLPGPQNPLGRVKYMFPNEHAIYLHDTPADHLFEERVRTHSHGCIRIAEPAEFGAFLFEENGLSREDVQTLMEEGERERVDLKDPIPVYIVYLTAWTTPEGTVHFRRDRYEYDESLENALQPPSAAEEACATIQEGLEEMVVTRS